MGLEGVPEMPEAPTCSQTWRRGWWERAAPFGVLLPVDVWISCMGPQAQWSPRSENCYPIVPRMVLRPGAGGWGLSTAAEGEVRN